MTAHVKVLHELVRDSLYPVDESAVASAILFRARARRALCDVSLVPPSVRRGREAQHSPPRANQLRGWLLSGD
jgi:hypothetical protein